MTTTILDFAQNKDLLYAAVIGFAMGLGTVVNLAILDRTRKQRISEKVLREDNADHERRSHLAEAKTHEAVRLILLGVEIMTPEQVARWAGVREFLAVYGGGSPNIKGDGAGTEESAREGHSGAEGYTHEIKRATSDPNCKWGTAVVTIPEFEIIADDERDCIELKWTGLTGPISPQAAIDHFATHEWTDAQRAAILAETADEMGVPSWEPKKSVGENPF